MDKAIKNRKVISAVTKRHSSGTGRIIVFTGARQTGKTTLARELFPDYEYISVEDPVTRGEYSRMTAGEWNNLYPYAILDEVQKEPKLIESKITPSPGPSFMLDNQFALKNQSWNHYLKFGGYPAMLYISLCFTML